MTDIAERLRKHTKGAMGGGYLRQAANEIERLRAGLQLIADDTHRLMNEVARQTAASILGGKPVGAADQPSEALRDWIKASRHHHGCGAFGNDGKGEQFGCTCGRDALLRASDPTDGAA